MAEAPTPGNSHVHKVQKATQVVARRAVKPTIAMTVGDESRTLDLNLVTIDDEEAVLRATKMPYELVMETFCGVALVVIWWLAGRQGGVNASWQATKNQWPNNGALMDLQEQGRFSFEMIEPEDDVPLA